MDWLHAIMVDPWDHPQGWFAYLAAPVLTSLVLTRLMPNEGKTSITALSTVLSVFLYFAIYIVLYGVSSTIGIGVMFALVVYSGVCALTVGIVRAVQTASPSA